MMLSLKRSRYTKYVQYYGQRFYNKKLIKRNLANKLTNFKYSKYVIKIEDCGILITIFLYMFCPAISSCFYCSIFNIPYRLIPIIC